MPEPQPKDANPEIRRIVDAALGVWIRRLIDQSRANSLLFYRDLKIGTLDLSAEIEAVRRLLAGDALAVESLVSAGRPEVKPLAASIPAKLLYDCVKRGQSPGVTIRSANHEKAPFNVVIDDAVVIGHDAKDFPELSGFKDRMKGPAKIAELPSLEPVLPAVSVDETRINMSGVYLRFCKNLAVATDGHRLHVMRIPGATIEGDFLIPRKVVELVDDIAAATKSPAVGHFYKDGCSFRIANYEVVSRYIEGTFPDYDQVIPKTRKHHIVVDRRAFMEALSSSLPFSTDKAKGVKLEVKDDKLTLSKQHPDLGEFTRALPCFGATGEVSIGLNANYLLDALRFIKEERVVIQLEDDVSPMVIDSADESLKFVVMPMRL